MADDIIKKYKGEFKELEEDFNHPHVCNGLHKCKVFIPNEDDKKAKTVAEDYAYYLNEIPGFLFELGGYNPDSNKPPTAHHTADFTVDDKSMLLGVKVMTNLALDFLKSD